MEDLVSFIDAYVTSDWESLRNIDTLPGMKSVRNVLMADAVVGPKVFRDALLADVAIGTKLIRDAMLSDLAMGPKVTAQEAFDKGSGKIQTFNQIRLVLLTSIFS